jgi:hypothetical protein
MLCTAELNMAKPVNPNGADVFLDNKAWAICSTYHTVLKASPGVAISRRNMIFNIPLIANWNRIGDYRQCKTNLNTARKSSMQVNHDYKVGNKVLVKQDGILCKTESPCSKKPWTIPTIVTNGTIRIQCSTKSERINV